MKIKYKSKQVELERIPLSFEAISQIIKIYFKVSNPILIIKDKTGLYEISSSSEFSKLSSKTIQEIQVKASSELFANSIHSLGFNKMDSIDTCTSHEKSDSDDESKRFELAKSEENDSARGISKTVGNSIFYTEASCQTEEISYSSVASGRTMPVFSNAFTQYDFPLEFDIKKLEETIAKEVLALKNIWKSQVGIVHKGFQCNTCHADPIIGPRFECATCKYSLCDKCEDLIRHPHELYKHKSPAATPVEKKDTKDAVIHKVLKLGLGNYNSVQMVAKSEDYNFNKIVEAFLFSNTHKT